MTKTIGLVLVSALPIAAPAFAVEALSTGKWLSHCGRQYPFTEANGS